MNIQFSKYYTPRPKQIEAHKNRAKYLLYGGSLGGGKSWYLCAEAIRNAMLYQGNRLVIVRKELSVIKRTILVTFFSICPPEIIKSYNQTSLAITFCNGSVLSFIEANVSKDPLLNKIKGMEFGWFGIDESNEVPKSVYTVLKSRLRWVLPDGNRPRYEGRLTSNPENCWLIPTFIKSTDENEVYVQALTTDNYDENDEYVLTLKEAFKDTPELYKRYLEGDWSTMDTANQLILSEWITKCYDLVDGYDLSLGVDVARFGNDKTVFVVLKKGNIELIERYSSTTITEVVNRTIELIKEFQIPSARVGIDSIGLGAGVVDSLWSKNYEVTEIVGGASPDEPDYEEDRGAFRPFNLRSQMFYQLRISIKDKRIGNVVDEELIEELRCLEYEIISDRRIRVLSKDKIKEKLGRSPDVSDALCYANYVRTKTVIDYPLPFI